MSANAMVVMILIGSFVWGGFLLILLTAVRRERHKAAGAPAAPPGEAGAADPDLR
ncbi:MAG TPA: hypothetical protein VML95_07090 [Longimicrobiales bacterium]|jgi:hypothetical protein|nr:hypothetical protein [Longimicrobiales bacterium]